MQPITERMGRRTARLPQYDYTRTGAYFVTVCTWHRACLFGEIVDERVRLSPEGEVVHEEWRRTALIRPGVELDAFIVMPNHLHGVILLPGSDISHNRTGSRQGRAFRASGSLGSVVAGFKQAVTLRLRRLEDPIAKRVKRVWQRNYYEHVVRTEAELSHVRRYIEENPRRWARER
jgi:REP element-mobilizing transposase RayT